MKITKRDVSVFVFGMLTWMAVEIIYDWKDIKKDIEKGYQDGKNAAE